MDSQIEFVGGPLCGHIVFRPEGETLPEEWLMSMGEPAEYRRMGRYLREGDGDYRWDGEYLVRDIEQVTSD